MHPPWPPATSTSCPLLLTPYCTDSPLAHTHHLQVARELFKAALKVDPRNDVVWETWISMEDELGSADTANELRVRRAEKQWEFAIPANFTSRNGSSSIEGSTSVQRLDRDAAASASSSIQQAAAAEGIGDPGAD
jgi:hypothetical protein